MSKFLTISGGVSLILIWVIYYLADWYNWYDVKGIWSLSSMISISLVFFGLSINEKNIKIKYLIFMPVAWFFAVTFLLYILDDPIDDYFNSNIFNKENEIDVFQTNKMNLSFIIAVTICFLNSINIKKIIVKFFKINKLFIYINKWYYYFKR